jgi:HEAT repeat protein
MWVRYRAAQTLRSLGTLSDKDSATHSRTCDAILSIGGGRASVPPLIEALQSDDRGVRYTAGMALGRIGPEARDAVPALIVLLKDPDLYVRQVAPNALGAIGPAAGPAVPALCEALKDREWLIRANAARALFEVDPRIASEKAIPVLNRVRSGPDALASFEATRILRWAKATGRLREPDSGLTPAPLGQ